MKRPFIYLAGLFVIISANSLMAVTAQENGNSTSDNISLNDSVLNNISQNNMPLNDISLNDTALNNTSTNNTTSNDISQNLSASYNTALNITQPEAIKPMGSTSNSSYMALSTTYYREPVQTDQVVGSGAKDSKSAFKIDTSDKTVIDVSKMGYIIQSIPHGYV